MNYSILFKKPPSEFAAFVNTVFECFSPWVNGVDLLYTKVRDEHVRLELRDSESLWGTLEIKTTFEAGVVVIEIAIEDPPQPEWQQFTPEEIDTLARLSGAEHDAAVATLNKQRTAEWEQRYKQDGLRWATYVRDRMHMVSERLGVFAPQEQGRDTVEQPITVQNKYEDQRAQVVALFDETYEAEKLVGAVRTIDEWIAKHNLHITARTLENWRKRYGPKKDE